MSTIPSKSVNNFLAPFAPEVRALVLAARAFVLKMIPKIEERVDSKARIIAYTYGPESFK
ncbi:MAG TPA: hypothetical protein VG759_28865 [Candidatus Angelobacter sp.]|jgi:hypothetical protein|nr:hypothetical protein [Candidatus Angelobacter sp.]